MEVRIIVARCSNSRGLYGIRFEQREPRVWVFDWAFAIKAGTAQREGYDQTTIEGRFEIGEHYPGCPHCGAPSIFRCGCGRVNCWDGHRREVTCAWCGQTGTLSGAIESLTGTGDM